jgi:hypothetical protein
MVETLNTLVADDLGSNPRLLHYVSVKEINNVTSEQADITACYITGVPKIDTNGCTAKVRLVKRVYAMPRSQMSRLIQCTTSCVDYRSETPRDSLKYYIIKYKILEDKWLLYVDYCVVVDGWF